MFYFRAPRYLWRWKLPRELFECIHITSGIHTAVVCSKITYGAATPPNLAVIEANPVPIERTEVGYSSAT